MRNKPALARRRLTATWLFVALMVPTCALPPAQARQRLRPEEIVARHLESIGSAETRASITSRLISGTVIVTFRSPGTGQLAGRAVFASEGTKNVLGMAFDSNDYPREQIGYDGSNVSISYVRPGVRSTFADFFVTHDTIVRHGLLGGALSTAWPLANLTEREARLEYSGTERINNQETHKVRYNPRRGSDMRITLYFDRENFQHVRTEYDRTIPAMMGPNIDASSRQQETRYRVVEEFSDFRRESGLTLPHTYKISFQFTTRAGTYNAEWALSLTEFAFNRRLSPQVFTVQTGS